MALDFPSPSQRAGTLAMQISPLGIVELSEEEFEVHGPRMQRYANAAAFYLGHHWGYVEPSGEPQLTLNYTKSLSDFLTNFCFTKGIQFKSDKMYTHIAPALLDRVWSRDNNKGRVFWEIGNMGSIFGDVFVKVTYEPGWTDPLGFRVPAKVRIIPLNPSFCFPRWHPHDKERLEEFKLKYRFWSTAPDGTRMTNTYVEILTDTAIREYVNDELISERPNPVGTIPIVHIQNAPAQGSPWGLSDIWEILGTNREYNEKATEVSDIINYHANPITVITGGKAPAMDVGPNKVWGVDNADAKVYNLENNFQGLQAAVGYLEMLKTYMFEAMGVPVSALGQEQAISNTSGVALSIQFMPTMQKFQLKQITYGQGFKRVCALALRTLAIFEPETLLYNPETDGIIQPGQPEIADRSDPAFYDIDVDWAPPLPVDLLIKLEEIQMKLALRLESRKGALADLGEEFPDEKLLELAQELIEDAKDQAAIDMIKAHVAAALIALTGVAPEGMEPVDQEPTKNADGSVTPPPVPPAQQQAGNMSLPALSELTGSSDTRNLMAEIVTRAYGYKEQARRDIDKTAVQ